MTQRHGREEVIAALAGYQAQVVLGMGAALGFDRARYSRKGDMIEAMAARLVEGFGLADQMARLEPVQREALAYVSRKGGLTPVRAVQSLLRGQVESTERADRLLRDLLGRGLLLFSAYAGSWKLDLTGHDPTFQNRLVWVPRGVASLASKDGGWAKLIDPAPTPARVEAGDVGALLRDLYLMARGLQARAVRITQQGAPHQGDFKRLVAVVRPHASAKEFEQAAGDTYFALRLGLAAGLVREDTDGLFAAEASAEFTQAPRPAQIARLYAAWLGLSWSELERVPTLVVDSYMTSYGDVPDAAALQSARRVIVEALAELGEDQWWSVASLIRAIRRRDPALLQSNPSTVGVLFGGGYYPYIQAHTADSYRGIRRAGVEYQASLLKRDVDWDEVEGAFVRQVLSEPLRWLGLVDLGWDEERRLVSLRLTPVGRAVLLGAASAPAPAAALAARAAGPRLVVQPNFEVIVLDVGGSLDLMARLDQFATQRSVDRAAVYHLSREGLVRALQGGARLADIERLLEAEGAAPLPQNVGYSLTEWARQFERVTVRRAASLVEADSADQLDRWLADRELAPLLGTRLSPTVALVAAGQAEALAGRLARRADLVVEQATPPPPGSIKLRDDDALRVKAETLGRFESHRLEGFAERVTGEPRAALFRLTAESLARARAAGWTASTVLALLQARLGGEPPPALALMVRGWLGEFAPAQQAVVRLVRLPDPAVWPLVERVATGGGLVARVGPALVVVDEAGLARVSEALSARGIRVEAALPEVAASPLLAGARGGAATAPSLGELSTLRGRALRDFLRSAITANSTVIIMHQAGNQKSPKRHVVQPRYLDHRPSGHYLVAATELGTERGFKLDDIFGVALEEKT